MIANKRELAKIGNWLVEGDTGLSSLSMAAVAIGGSPSVIHHPHDPADFKRCVEFLDYCIDNSNRLTLVMQMSEFTDPWKRIKDNWLDLIRLYNEEKKQKTAPRLYAKMELLKL